jgi:hypothetical protein
LIYTIAKLILSPYLTLEIVDSRTILAKICVAKMTQRGPPQIQHVNDQNPACDPESYHIECIKVEIVIQGHEIGSMSKPPKVKVK